MLKLTKTGIGLLTRQYRAVLKKCFLINLGIFAATTVLTTEAYGGVMAGENNTADGWYSIALGYENASHGGYSSAVGYQNTTNGWVSSAYGVKNVAKGVWSAAFGNKSSAYGASSFAFGNQATAGVESDYISGNDGNTRTIDRYATAVGNFVQATGLYALALGNQKSGMTQTTASGTSAIAIGTGAQATHDNSVAIGTNSVSVGENTISVGNSTTQRQIKYVAAGTNDTDAVNYSQIKNFITASALTEYAKNSTTLSGYGITDAYTKTEVNNAISSAVNAIDLSNYYTKSYTYSRDEINNIQSLNNYYRKDKKSGILNGFEAGKIGNENDDNFSKFRAVNGDFASKNPSRLGAFAKCGKACPRPSERFPASLEKNSAFEQYSRSARGTFLFGFQPNKNVLDSFSKLTVNDNFHLVNDGIFSNQSTTFDAKVAENVPAAELRFNIANETGKEFAKMPFCAPTVAGTSIFFRQKNIEVLDSFYKNSQCLKASNDNFAITTFLRAV